MIGMKVKFNPRKPRDGIDTHKVKRAVDRSTFRNLGHAGAAVRMTARWSIRRSQRPAAPGSPPRTRRGQLKKAIVYAVEKTRQRVVVGPTHNIVGPSAMAHEFGGRFRGQRYPKRPLMGPALMKNIDRLPRFWAGSVN